jgi:hypothetical protein
MNRIGKSLFVVTALTPVLWACAISQFRNGDNATAWWYLGISGGLVAICVLLILICRRNGEREKLFTKKVKPADKEILAFLLAYLLPLFSKDAIGFTGDLVVAVYVLLVIGLTIYHSNSYTFNPLLSLIFRYHFYEVEGLNGMTYLLLTNKTILSPENEIAVVKMYDYIYLDVE